MRLHVTPQEAVDIVKLSRDCMSPDKFDAAGWIVGLAVLLGTTVEEMRERAGSFPPGSLTEVVVTEKPPAERWEA